MNSVPRKLTLGLIIAFGAVACGDDVTVSEEPPPTPVVRSVVVSPSSATVAAGASFTFGAAVDADAPLARTVTWSSSNAAVASVDANGVATAVATLTAGGVSSICAASTADANVKGCAQLTVTPAAAAATIDISAVTTDCEPLSQANPAAIAGVCGLNVPVSVNNVYGQITVAANVNRPIGSSATAAVIEIVNAAGTVEAADTLTLSSSANVESDALALQQSNTFHASFQTAEYAINATSGAATVLHTNGPKRIRARLIGAGASATAERQYTFNNVNGFHVAVTTNLATGNNANGVAVRQVSTGGFSWNGGTPLALRATAISYTGQTIGASAGTTVNFGSAGCDNSGIGARAAAATVTGNVLTGTLTYTNQTGGAAGNVTGYETAAGCVAAGEVPFARALTSDGNPFITVVLGGIFGANNTLNAVGAQVNPTSTAPAIRLDNRAPQGEIVVVVNPNGRGNGWLNDQVVFNAQQPAGGAAATSNNMIGNLVAGTTSADGGFGGLAFAAKAGTTSATANTAADVANAAGLAPSVSNVTYCVKVYALDGFANRTPNPANCTTPVPGVGTNVGGSTQIGVDRAPPVAAFSGGLAANARLSGATVGAEFSVAVNDTGLVGNSGMNPVSPVTGSVQTRNSTPPDPTCFFGTGGACAQAALVGGALPILTTSTVAASAVNAYYIFNGSARDAAGNTTTVGPRVIVYDASFPIVANTSAPATVAAPGYSASSMVSEDVDIQSQWFSVAFAGAPAPLAPALIGQAPTVVSAFNPTTLTHTNFAITQVVNLPLAIQPNMDPVQANLVLQSGVMANARGQSNLQTTATAATPTITAPTALAIPASWTAYGTPTFVSAGVTGITSGVSAGNAANPTSTNITVTTTGATAIFNNPFSRVDFYALDQSLTEYRFIGSAAPAALNDNGVTRTFNYTINVVGSAIGPVLFGPVPPAAGATYASTFIAVGFGASGAVGMVSAGGLAVNIRN